MCFYVRVTAMTEDVGGMIRQWTLSSALAQVLSTVTESIFLPVIGQLPPILRSDWWKITP